MLVGTLKQLESVLIQLFTLGSLLSASQSKSLSSEVYYSKAEPQRDVAILAFTRAASLKLTRLLRRWIKRTTFL